VADLELPCGVNLGSGRIERHLEVKKFTAKAQRDASSTKNAAQRIDAILKPSLVSLDGKRVGITTLKSMLVGDRDWLCLALRDVTWPGKPLTGTFSCGECKENGDPHKMEHEVSFEEIEVTSLPEHGLWWDTQRIVRLSDDGPQEHADFDLVEEDDAAARKKLHCRVFQLKDDDLGVDAFFRYPNGGHQKTYAPMAENPERQVEMLQTLMGLTLVQLDGTVAPRKGHPIEIWDEVPLDVMEYLELEFLDKQPGPNTVMNVECHRGHDNTVPLAAVDFLSQARAK
jgi:hypothetical protein